MKRIIFISLIGIMLLGCTTVQENKESLNNKTVKSFEYYYPSISSTRGFDTLDEAYDYIDEALQVLGKTVSKNLAKGLTAKLSGPSVKEEKPVTVSYFLVARDTGSIIDLTKIDGPLEKPLRNAVSVSVVFLVFFEDQGISISKYYLKDGYVYNSNSQYKSFNFKGKKYLANYPIAWGMQAGFQYLKKEKN